MSIAQRPRVTALISTAQRAADIDAVLASVCAQTWPDIRIVIRDDGSTDGTFAKLADAAAACKVHAVDGVAVGPVYAFLSCLDYARDADVVLYADASEPWPSDAVERAVERLSTRPPGVPALDVPGLPVFRHSRRDLRTLLVEAPPAGQPMALNRAAADLISRSGWPRRAVSWTWWCHLAVGVFGEVVGNGAPPAKRRAKSLEAAPSPPRADLIGQARDFRRIFGAQLDEDARALIDDFTGSDSFGGRLRFLASAALSRHRATEMPSLRSLILGRRGVGG